MLFILIPSLLIVTGVALAARVIYKKIPPDIGRWSEAVSKADFGPTFYERAWATLALESKKILLSTSAKLVHRLKITSLKTDNFFGKILQEIKTHRSGMESKPEPPPFRIQVTPVLTESKTRVVEAKAVEVGATSQAMASSFELNEKQLINQLAYNPKDVSAYKHLGWLYLENDKPMEARQAFKMAVKLGSRDRMVIAKLLEMGGTVHKEGIASYSAKAPQDKSNAAIAAPARGAVLSGSASASKAVKPKESGAQKIRVRKI